MNFYQFWDKLNGKPYTDPRVPPPYKYHFKDYMPGSRVGGAELKPISDEDMARYGTDDVITHMMNYGKDTTRLGPQMTDKELRKFGGLEESAIPVYRGESIHNKGGNYWTPDKEWARQFTQTGQENEVHTAMIDTSVIYRKNPLPKAVNEEGLEEAVKEAKALKFSAVWVD